MMKKFFLGFKYAFQGLTYAFATQINFKVHSFTALAVCILGWAMDITVSEWLWVVSAIAFVLIAELFNTALEVLVDLVSPAYHPQAGKVKDLASAAVLVTAILAFAIGLFIFVPRIFF